MKLKFKKKNYYKYFTFLIVLYFISGIIGISGIFYLNDYKNTKHEKRIKGILHNIENKKNNYDKRVFSLEYFLFPKKNNEKYVINFTKNESYNINDDYNITKFTNNLLGNPKNSRARSSGYFDIFNKEKIIFAGGDGIFGYFDIDYF